jgi:hypothetical protein
VSIFSQDSFQYAVVYDRQGEAYEIVWHNWLVSKTLCRYPPKKKNAADLARKQIDAENTWPTFECRVIKRVGKVIVDNSSFATFINMPTYCNVLGNYTKARTYLRGIVENGSEYSANDESVGNTKRKRAPVQKFGFEKGKCIQIPYVRVKKNKL